MDVFNVDLNRNNDRKNLLAFIVQLINQKTQWLKMLNNYNCWSSFLFV